MIPIPPPGNIIDLPNFSFLFTNLFLTFAVLKKLGYQMFAIVNIAGQQFKVTKDQTLYVHHLSNEEGANIEFSDVLLINDEGKVKIGTPNINGARVTATVLENLVKGDKVLVFKKKRRKGYRLFKGHRQQFSKIKIDTIQA